MSLPQQIAVSAIPSAGSSSLGAIVDTGPTQNGARTFSINSASLSTGDQVQVLGSNDGFVADAFILGNLNTSDNTTPGQNTALVSPYTARYLRTYRVLGTAAVTVEAAENSPSSGGGGGSTGPLTSMTPFVQPNLAGGGNIGTNAVTTVDTYTSFDVDQTTAGQALTFFAPTSTTVDKVEFVSNDGTTSFTMYGQTIQIGTFGIVKYNSVSGAYTRPSYLSLGGDALGGVVNVGTLDAHAFSVNANGKTWGTSDGTTTTLGIAAGSVGGSTLVLQAGSGGASLDSTGAVTIAGTSATSLKLGGAAGAGIGIGVAPVAGKITIDTANEIDIGTTAAATVKIGGTSLTSLMSILIGSGAQLNIGGSAASFSSSADSVQVATNGNGAVLLTASGSGSMSLVSGGIMSIDTAGAGTVQIAATHATTFNLGNATAGFLATLNGPFKSNVTPLLNVALGGNIGTAAATVNIGDFFTVAQTTAGQVLTVAAPTGVAATAGRRVYVQNVGSVDFTMYGKTVKAAASGSQSLIVLSWDATNSVWVTTV